MAEGFVEDDYEPAEVWPECWPAGELFCEFSGQWRLAPSGLPDALDYASIFLRMERLGLPDNTAWNQLFDDLRVIERAALAQIRANNPRH